MVGMSRPIDRLITPMRAPPILILILITVSAAVKVLDKNGIRHMHRADVKEYAARGESSVFCLRKFYTDSFTEDQCIHSPRLASIIPLETKPIGKRKRKKENEGGGSR